MRFAFGSLKGPVLPVAGLGIKAQDLREAEFMHTKELARYGLAKIADFRIASNSFQIEVIDEVCVGQTGCIYAFVINGEIVRVGSSAGPLKKRLADWRRDVSKALSGGPSPTPLAEANSWRNALAPGTTGELFARRGTEVTTPVGTFTAHLDEERVLIARYEPKFNRSSR